jgi:hypothetical protein
MAWWFGLVVGCGEVPAGDSVAPDPTVEEPGTTPPAETTPYDPETTDRDGDGAMDAADNCPGVPNVDQADADADGLGDACDGFLDVDVDGVDDPLDNCPGKANGDQADGDGDGVGDACDLCPAAFDPLQDDVDADGIGDACFCDSCADGQWCYVHPGLPDECRDTCLLGAQCGTDLCCPEGSTCDAAAGECRFADIWVEPGRLATSIEIKTLDVDEDDCQVVEGCLGGTGLRRVLRFDTQTPNTGDGDLRLGDPTAELNPHFVYSECHDHYHFDTYAAYSLLDELGNAVAPGHKQAFCLMDLVPWSPGIDFGDAQYDCYYQGISKGFSDVYDSYLDCQFIDITDVPSGSYRLQVALNTERFLAETDYANNVTEVMVYIP